MAGAKSGRTKHPHSPLSAHTDMPSADAEFRVRGG
jgi:hypothetical protein